MKKNDIVEIEITALSSECSGIGKKDGMVIFVPFSAIGDKLEVNKTYCYGKIERIITPSPDRVTPDCPIYTRCGGCSLRHISYEAQLRAKEQFVKDAFTRIGGLSPEFLPIIRNTNINGYRNKLQIPIGADKDGNLIAGFYAFHSHRIVPCEKCLLQPDIFSKITADFLKISTGLNLTAYDETTHKGILRHLYLRKGYYSGEICLCIVVAKNVPEIKILSDKLLEKYPEIVSSVINVNNRDTNVILGDEEIVLTSKNYICDIMCKNAVNIAPKAFYQVNTPCAEQLYSSACDFAEPKGKTVLDLYCGAGTIGLSMARTAKKIIGVEIVPEAIENAKQNALANDITNCEFICADAAEAAASGFAHQTHDQHERAHDEDGGQDILDHDHQEGAHLGLVEAGIGHIVRLQQGEQVGVGEVHGVQRQAGVLGLGVGFCLRLAAGGDLLGEDVAVHRGDIDGAVLEQDLLHLILFDHGDHVAVFDLVTGALIGGVVVVGVEILERHRQHQCPHDQRENAAETAVFAVLAAAVVIGHIFILRLTCEGNIISNQYTTPARKSQGKGRGFSCKISMNVPLY